MNLGTTSNGNDNAHSLENHPAEAKLDAETPPAKSEPPEKGIQQNPRAAGSKQRRHKNLILHRAIVSVDNS
jgi:hypothetical protein